MSQMHCLMCTRKPSQLGWMYHFLEEEEEGEEKYFLILNFH